LINDTGIVSTEEVAAVSDTEGPPAGVSNALRRPITRRSFIAGAGSAVLLAACGSSGNKNATGPTTTAGSTTSTGGAAAINPNPATKTIKVAVTTLEEQYPDPGSVVGGNLFPVLWNVADGLLNNNLAGNLVPGLATSWTVSPDHLTWTFNLRSGVLMQDGSPFTATDVKTAIDRVTGPMASNPRFVGWVPLQAVFDSVTVINPMQVQIKTKVPYGSLTSSIPAPIATNYYNSVGETHFENFPIAAGPFKFVSQQLNTSMTFSRFDGFWDKTRLTNFPNLIMDIIPDASTKIAAIETGQVDVACGLDPVSATQLASQSNIRLLRNPESAQATVYFPANWNTTAPSPFKDLRVRKALLMAVDRAGIAKSLYRGYGSVPANVTFPTTLGYDTTTKPYPYDPGQAKQLLQQAGAAGLHIDFTSYSATSSITDIQSLVQAIASYWQQVGCKVNVNIVDAATYLPKVRDHAYGGAVILGSPAQFFFDPGNYYVFYHTKGAYSGVSNPELDTIINQMRASTDVAVRTSLAGQMGSILYNQLYGLPMVDLDEVHAIGPHVASWQLMAGNPYPGPFWRMEAK
jgi:peptide/nickel transport system substrate-binding protein